MIHQCIRGNLVCVTNRLLLRALSSFDAVFLSVLNIQCVIWSNSSKTDKLTCLGGGKKEI